MAKFPNIEIIDAFDFSEASIQIAKGYSLKESVENKCNFFTESFNTIILEPNTYDLVLCSGSLHHVLDIEHLLSQVRKSLKSGGVFIANEYVGNCYNIYGESQIALINSAISGLPEQFCLSPGVKFRNGTIEEVFNRDPSEGVRSKLIPEFLRIFFAKVDERQFGGALLHPLYPMLNISEIELNPEVHQALISSFILIDSMLKGQNKSDFSFFICRN
jgi:SAM-dependent methyltransferase